MTTRRPLKSRSSAWAGALSRTLTRAHVSPNAISLASVVFAAAACAALLSLPRVARGVDPWTPVLLLAGAAGIQLRLLCNLLDGMVAVEGRRGGPTGELWNEVPDRFADLMIIVPVGYVASGWPFAHELGWLAGALALLAAYVRTLGGSLGAAQDFCGPMAKPHRMALLTVSCLLAEVAWPFDAVGTIFFVALIVLIAGTAVTIARRLWRLSRILGDRAR